MLSAFIAYVALGPLGTIRGRINDNSLLAMNQEAACAALVAAARLDTGPNTSQRSDHPGEAGASVRGSTGDEKLLEGRARLFGEEVAARETVAASEIDRPAAPRFHHLRALVRAAANMSSISRCTGLSDIDQLFLDVSPVPGRDGPARYHIGPNNQERLDPVGQIHEPHSD